ncbi:MAG: YncE family protein [Acidobacteriaceae bacterium]
MIKIATAIVLCLLCGFAAQAQTEAPLVLSKTISLPGVVGGFDHFAINLSGGVLFAAAKGNHTVEAINLRTGKIAQNITGLAKPHGLAWVPETHRLYVADGKLAQLQVYQGNPLKASGTLKLSDDADDMVYDKQDGMLYVGHGGSDATNPGRVAVVNTKDFTLAADLPVAAHPEALDLDGQGQRVFANIADAAQVIAINTKTNAIEDTWKLKDASDNTPMAYDAHDQILFIACRKPPVLIALDGNTGKEMGRLPSDAGADDLFYDAKLHRVYVITGSGAVDVYSMGASTHLTLLGKVHTVSGAKTGLFVPSQNLLYVGIPGIAGKSAQIRVYRTNPAVRR